MTIRPLYHEHNKGKGGALQTALAAATGDVLVVQDADLEYDPQDWTLMSISSSRARSPTSSTARASTGARTARCISITIWRTA